MLNSQRWFVRQEFVKQYFLTGFLVFVGLWGIPEARAQVQQIPQVKAFLPNITEVRPGEVTAIDGLWKISTINKLIRIDRGRAYAIDGWVHLFILKVQPAMVVIQDIVETEPGSFSGYDLPLLGAWAADVTGDRILDIVVAAKTGKVRYQLIPQQLDDEQAFFELVKAARRAGR